MFPVASSPSAAAVAAAATPKSPVEKFPPFVDEGRKEGRKEREKRDTEGGRKREFRGLEQMEVDLYLPYQSAR